MYRQPPRKIAHANRLIGLLLCYCLSGTATAQDDGVELVNEGVTNEQQSDSNKRKTIGEHFSSLNPFKNSKEQDEGNTALFAGEDLLDRDFSGQIDRQHKVEDLAYGELLMHYFNNDHYEALVQARVMQESERLKHNKEHTDLLLAQLYILEGMPEHAKNTLQGIARNRISPELRTTALFQLARIHTYQGSLDKAKEILEKDFPPLESHQELERKVLLANIYALQKNKEAVVHTLIGVEPNITRNAYIKYNLASAGLFSGREEFALPILLDLTKGDHADLESRTLKDFANLSVGLYYLKQEKLEEAKSYFEAVGYLGPHSSAALYYIAWIELQQEEYKTAFAYWVDLSKRNPTDPYVGRSYLIRPYSLEKLGSTHLALSGYLRAIELYEHLIKDVDSTIDIINTPEWLAKFHPGTLDSISIREKIAKQPGWIDTQTNEINFLINLYSSDAFAVLHQNFWELELLQQQMANKRKSFQVFQLQKQTHDDKYERLIPEAKAKINSRQIALIEERLAAIGEEIQAISNKENFFAAPNQKQLERLQRIEYLHSILDKENESEHQTQRRYLAYLEGINAWEMSQDAPERQWKIREQHKQLTKLLAETEKHKTQIQLGIDNANYYDALMPELSYLSKVLDLRTKEIELVSLKLQKKMREEALAILEERKKEYKTLRIRAKLAAARLQDSMVTGGRN